MNDTNFSDANNTNNTSQGNNSKIPKYKKNIKTKQ